MENGRAVGVSYMNGGVPQTARARGEVIVAGGVFNSPQLLQLSGIGAGRSVAGGGIEVVRDMPAVGNQCRIISTSGWRIGAVVR